MSLKFDVSFDDETEERAAIREARKRLRHCLCAAIAKNQRAGWISRYTAEAIRAMADDEWFRGHDRYLAMSLDVPGDVSYAYRPEDRYDSKRRRRLSLDKYLSKYHRHLCDSFSGIDYVCRSFRGAAHASVSRSRVDGMIRVVYGPELAEAYRQEWGGHSCMTGFCSDRQRYIDHYALNPDRVGLALLYPDGFDAEPVARAMVWHTDQGITVLDRRYPNNTDWSMLIQLWAQHRGYAIRKGDALPNTSHPIDWLPYEDSPVEPEQVLTATLDFTESRDVPYQDTFCWGGVSGDQLIHGTWYRSGDIRMDHGLCSTEGGPFAQSDGQLCSWCDLFFDELIDGPDGEDYCEDCYSDRFSYCKCCERDRDADEFETVRTSRGEGYWCSSCASAYATECEDCSTVWQDSDICHLSTEDGDRSVCTSCADNYAVCDRCGVDVHCDDRGCCEHDENGDYCEPCAEAIDEQHTTQLTLPFLDDGRSDFDRLADAIDAVMARASSTATTEPESTPA